MADLKAQEIFAAGTWNGMTFTDADLDGMVRAFDGLGLAGKVPLKFGHDSAKQVKDGKPALGWVSKIWRDGRRLLADFTNVPDAVMSAIREKMYKHVSIELLQNVKAGTREIPWVPDAVALLGADQPAVGILKELEALTMSARTVLRFDARVAFKRDFHSPTGDQASMTEAEIAELRARLAAAETDAAKFKSQADTVTAEREQERRKVHSEKLRAIVVTAINAKRVAPSTLTHFSTRFGADNSDAMMGATAEQVEEWVKTCAPADKTEPQKGRKGFTTQEGDRVQVVANTNAEAYELAFNDAAKDLGYDTKDIFSDANKSLRVIQRVQFSKPKLYQAYVAEPYGEFKAENADDQEAA